MPGGEEEKQEIENLFEKIIKKHFPNLMKEMGIQVGSTESLRQDGAKQDHTRNGHFLKH